MSDEHRRPPGVSDRAVAAVGMLTEALETVEQVRGHLYALHQLTGRADFMLDDVVALLRLEGHDALADRIDRELIGRNVIAGRWTYQIIEDYDDGYYALLRDIESTVRRELVGGRRHVHEAELRELRRTHGEPGHEAGP
jgi:hypothetical protein